MLHDVVSELTAYLRLLMPLLFSPRPGNAFVAVSGARHGLIGVLPALIADHTSPLARARGLK